MDKHFVLVSYDIPNTKRRTKIHKALKAYGDWVQFSIFECWLTKTEYAKMRARLNPLIDSDVDSIRFYSICESCKAKVERIGGGNPRDEDMFMI
jgi:CRISPR-associated protein Cas2